MSRNWVEAPNVNINMAVAVPACIFVCTDVPAGVCVSQGRAGGQATDAREDQEPGGEWKGSVARRRVMAVCCCVHLSAGWWWRAQAATGVVSLRPALLSNEFVTSGKKLYNMLCQNGQ